MTTTVILRFDETTTRNVRHDPVWLKTMLFDQALCYVSEQQAAFNIRMKDDEHLRQAYAREMENVRQVLYTAGRTLKTVMDGHELVLAFDLACGAQSRVVCLDYFDTRLLRPVCHSLTEYSRKHPELESELQLLHAALKIATHDRTMNSRTFDSSLLKNLV